MMKTANTLRAAAIMLCILSSHDRCGCFAAPPMTRQSAREIIDNKGADPISGIWRIGGDGATIAILPQQGSIARFDIFLLDSPDMSVIPGKMTGSAVTTGQLCTYDATLSDVTAGKSKRFRCIMTIGNDGHLTIKPYKQGKRISLRRWLPHLFRITVSDYDTRPSGVDGAVKIYPPTTPSEPVLL